MRVGARSRCRNHALRAVDGGCELVSKVHSATLAPTMNDDERTPDACRIRRRTYPPLILERNTRSTSLLGSPSTFANALAPTPSGVLRAAEQETLATPRRRYGLLARALFSTLDLVYGRTASLERFVVLELVARVPYQAWENVGYVAISHVHHRPAFARRIFDYVRESRAQQDNEQWHLLILEELVARRAAGTRSRSWARFRLIPQLLALVYYHVSWILYVLQPRWSYALNADFEDHAEHVYMRFVAEHPELDAEPWDSALAADYGSYATVGDVLRRIALDERAHRDESLARIETARFDAVLAAPDATSTL